MLPFFFPSLFITLLFFLSGIEKISHFSQTTAKFAKKMGVSLGLGQFFISGAIALELIAPLIIVGFTFTGLMPLMPMVKIALMALMAFTVVVTLLYHNPFNGREKYYAFMSNVSTLGGLMALYLYV